jgi:hypothetical protein
MSPIKSLILLRPATLSMPFLQVPVSSLEFFCALPRIFSASYWPRKLAVG